MAMIARGSCSRWWSPSESRRRTRTTTRLGLLEVGGVEGPQEAFRYDAAGNPHEAHRAHPERIYSSGNRLLRRGEVKYVWNDLGQLAEKRLGPQHSFRYLWTEDGQLATVVRPGGQTVDLPL